MLNHVSVLYYFSLICIEIEKKNKCQKKNHTINIKSHYSISDCTISLFTTSVINKY
jgi:hypothetical protein